MRVWYSNKASLSVRLPQILQNSLQQNTLRNNHMSITTTAILKLQ